MLSPSRRLKPAPVELARPARTRQNLPQSGGLEGVLRDTALVAFDRAACRFGTPREELALAFADPQLAPEYAREHGVDPRSVSGLLDGLLGRS